MASNHIGNDLASSLAYNGVGNDATWAAIGQIVNNQSAAEFKKLMGVNPTAIANVVTDAFNVSDIRDNMRIKVRISGFGPFQPTTAPVGP